MNIKAIVSGLFAIAKVVPKLLKLFEAISDKILEMRVNAIYKEYDQRGLARKALIQSIKGATSNEQRLHLSALLYALNTGKLSDYKLEQT